MTDPLSITASIAGLVTLADLVFCRTFAYVKAVKGAPKEIARLSSETGALYGILTRLHLLSLQLEGNEDISENATRVHFVHDCAQTLRRMSSKLAKYGSTPPSHHTFQSRNARMRWPFSASEVEDLIAEV